MFAKLFLLFAILPIIEIALLINVGENIGGWNTVAIVIITAFIGAKLVRQQGFATLRQAQLKTAGGELPGKELAEGVLLLISGVLLVTPGFITDGIGFLFALPATRPLIANYLMKEFGSKIHVQSSGFHSSSFQNSNYQQTPPKSSEDFGSQQQTPKRTETFTIDGEYEKKD